LREHAKVPREELLRIGVFSGERLEKEVEEFLTKYGEAIFDSTEVCVLRQLESLDDQCKGCSSFIGCKKKSMTVMATAILPVILISEIPSAYKEEICGYTLKMVERILRARTDEELESILDDM
jgi:hypothetical protein